MAAAEDSEEKYAYYAVLNVSREASDEEIKRSYRSLAQTYHPDKHSNTKLQQQASANFTRLQEAYEVLSDPKKREVYDIYGLQGLRAGLDVVPRPAGSETLKQEWEAFQQQQRWVRAEASTSYDGKYVFRVDATSLTKPYDSCVSRTPDLTSVAVNSQVRASLSDRDQAELGAQVNVVRGIGGGSFVCGYRRVLSPHTTVEARASVGMKSLASLQCTRDFSDSTGGTLAVTWQPVHGLGLEVGTTRQLTERTSGELHWAVGPWAAQGVALTVTHTGDNLVLQGAASAGVATGITGKVTYHVTERTDATLAVKLGIDGYYEAEVGGNHRLSEFSVAGASVSYGLEGVTVKLLLTRREHKFVCPILLSQEPDVRVLAASMLGPPLATFLLRRYVVRPFRKAWQRRKAREAAREHQQVVRANLAAAAAAAEVMRPVAQRKLQAEIAKAGLIIVEAKYGVLESMDTPAAPSGTQPPAQPASSPPSPAPATVSVSTADAAAAPGKDDANGAAAGPGSDRGAAGSEAADGVAADGETARGGGEDAGNPGAGGPAADEEPAGAGPSGRSAGSGPAAADAPESAGAAADVSGDDGELPSWVDVTIAVRFLVDKSQVHFYKGVPKTGMMGFCDPAPAQPKHLRVRYLWRDQPLEAIIEEQEAAKLPGAGNPITAADTWADVMAAARQLGFTGSRRHPDRANGSAVDGWTGNPVYSPASSQGDSDVPEP